MKFLFPLALIVIAFISCRNDKADQLYPASAALTCDTTSVSYSGSVKQIVITNCAIAGCHDAATKENGYDFSTYASLNQAQQNDQLLPAILHDPSTVPMPNNGLTLPACDLNKIVAWAHQGALNN